MADIHNPAHEPYLDKIQLNNVDYYLHDDCAHKKIEDIESKITGSVTYLGRTETIIVDGSTDPAVKINGETVTAVPGNIVLHDTQEFLFTESGWARFGDQVGFGSLAFKDTASGNYTPAGEVSVGLGYDSTAASTSYTPVGTISNVVTTMGTASKVSGSDSTATADDGVTFFDATVSGTTLTFSCTKKKVTDVSPIVAAPTFTGTDATISVNYDKAKVASTSFDGTQGSVTVS